MILQGDSVLLQYNPVLQPLQAGRANTVTYCSCCSPSLAYCTWSTHVLIIEHSCQPAVLTRISTSTPKRTSIQGESWTGRSSSMHHDLPEPSLTMSRLAGVAVSKYSWSACDVILTDTCPHRSACYRRMLRRGDVVICCTWNSSSSYQTLPSTSVIKQQLWQRQTDQNNIASLLLIDWCRLVVVISTASRYYVWMIRY